MKAQFSGVPTSADVRFPFIFTRENEPKPTAQIGYSSDYVLAKTKVSVARLRSADAAEAYLSSTSAAD